MRGWDEGRLVGGCSNARRRSPQLELRAHRANCMVALPVRNAPYMYLGSARRVCFCVFVIINVLLILVVFNISSFVIVSILLNLAILNISVVIVNILVCFFFFRFCVCLI